MKRPLLWMGAGLGLLTSLIVMALSYLGNATLHLPFLPFDLFDWSARHLPGFLIETSISTIVFLVRTLRLGPTDTTAKLAEQIQSLGLVAVTGIVFGAVLGWIAGRRPAWLTMAGLMGGVILAAGALFAELSLAQPSPSSSIGLVWIMILVVGWGVALGIFIDAYRLSLVSPPPSPSGEPALAGDANARAITRRNFLALAGAGVVSLLVLVFGLRNFRQEPAKTNIPVTGNQGGPTPAPSAPASLPQTSGPAASPSADVLAKRIQPAPGTRPEITSPQDFYRIDIDTRPTEVDGNTWRLSLGGLVNKPLSLSLDDLRKRPAVTQAVTLSCISNPVGGDLISANYWTGVRFKDILAEAGLKPGVQAIDITSADGFYESISIKEAMDERTLLVYAMNGQTLLPEHGFPLRVYIPNHYGMKQPKWITDMMAVDQPRAGYWVERGWSQAAYPQTTSVIDTSQIDKTQLQPTGMAALGGIAWAGERGISKVEVQVDKGPWVEASLRTPAVSPLTWVQWRYDWKATPGEHTINVRATDGTGSPQIPQARDTFPDGATGIDSVLITI